MSRVFHSRKKHTAAAIACTELANAQANERPRKQSDGKTTAVAGSFVQGAFI
jgi:hypothetical protein